jgi:hypothetical protein
MIVSYAKLSIENCHVCLNERVMAVDLLYSELEKIFPQTESYSGEAQLEFGYDLNVETLYINVNYRDAAFNTENLMMLSIDGLIQIDALRRYCEMVLDHHKACKD